MFLITSTKFLYPNTHSTHLYLQLRTNIHYNFNDETSINSLHTLLWKLQPSRARTCHYQYRLNAGLPRPGGGESLYYNWCMLTSLQQIVMSKLLQCDN